MTSLVTQPLPFRNSDQFKWELDRYNMPTLRDSIAVIILFEKRKSLRAVLSGGRKGEENIQAGRRRMSSGNVWLEWERNENDREYQMRPLLLAWRATRSARPAGQKTIKRERDDTTVASLRYGRATHLSQVAGSSFFLLFFIMFYFYAFLCIVSTPPKKNLRANNSIRQHTKSRQAVDDP